MRFLIIDSSKLILERLEEIVASEKRICFVDKAINYNQAIALFKENFSDVILLDGDLPKNEAFKFLVEVKKENPITKVVILSAQTDKFIKEKWLAFGADYFFDKYHQFENIIELISAG
jgi:two-component system, OmpR family, response regulator